MTPKRIAQKYLFPVFIAALPFAAYAQDTAKVEGTVTSATRIVNNLVTLAFIIAILVFAFGIIKLISAAGEPEKLKKAKGIIVWGVVGLAILASITGIIAYVREYFGIGVGTDISVPHITP